MRDVILEKLREIESAERVRILLAVEAGSRAWGFVSPDSDYDVRFIYARSREDYLRLEPVRDVIELPVGNALDINGWDLSKALRLLYRSNPSPFEWTSSPITYVETPFRYVWMPLLRRYFSPRNGVQQYLSMARNNWKNICRREVVKVKRYFHVLRPVLAARWILDWGTPPPVSLATLIQEELDEMLRSCVCALIDAKISGPKTIETPRIPTLDSYLKEHIRETGNRLAQMPEEPERGWQDLNQLFLSELDSPQS